MKRVLRIIGTELAFVAVFYFTATLITDYYFYENTMAFMVIIMLLNVIRGAFEYAIVLYGNDVRRWWVLYNRRNFISWDNLFDMVYKQVETPQRMSEYINALLKEDGFRTIDYYFSPGHGVYFKRGDMKTVFLLKHSA